MKTRNVISALLMVECSQIFTTIEKILNNTYLFKWDFWTRTKLTKLDDGSASKQNGWVSSSSKKWPNCKKTLFWSDCESTQ